MRARLLHWLFPPVELDVAEWGVGDHQSAFENGRLVLAAIRYARRSRFKRWRGAHIVLPPGVYAWPGRGIAPVPENVTIEGAH